MSEPTYAVTLDGVTRRGMTEQYAESLRENWGATVTLEVPPGTAAPALPAHLKPTVGRVVHWQPFNSTAPLAAIITAVDPDNFADDGYVNLAVFKLIGELMHFSAPFSETPEEGHWNWPPR